MTLSAFAVSGCESDIRGVTLAPVPAELRTCFGQYVPMPPKDKMTRRQAFALIAELKKSELAKSQCGARLIAFYETQAKVYAR